MSEQIQVRKQLFRSGTTGAEIGGSGFALLVCPAGNAVIRVNALSFSIREGEALLIRKEPEYELSSPEGCEFIRIDFTEEAFFQACLPVMKGCPLLSGFFIQRMDNITMSHILFTRCREDVTAPAERLLAEYNAHDTYYESVLLCELMSLLLTISRNSWEESAMSGQTDVRQLQKMLEYLVNNSKDVTLRSMSEAFNYHPNTVSVILKKGTGKSFQQLLEQTRMSHVSEMLGHMTVQDAAESCGYKNMSNFYIRFQNYFGMTPGEYAQKVNRLRTLGVKL